MLPLTLAACGEGGAIMREGESEAEAESESEAEAEGECGVSAAPEECDDGFDGVGDACVRQPSMDATRTQCGQITENCDTSGETMPDFACHDGDSPAPPDGPETVTLSGIVDVFGNGPDSDRVKVQVFDAAELDAAACAARAGGRFDAAWIVDAVATGEVAALGETVERLDWDDHSEPPPGCRACPTDDDARDGVPCALPTADCDPPCDLDANEWCWQEECLERKRWECRYSIDDVPTNRYLAIRTAGEDELADMSWAPMVQYAVYLWADSDKIDGGAYELEVNVLHRNDYASIPRTVIGRPIPAGQGAVAGEVHDCDDMRVSFAQVGVFPAPEAYTFFNGNPIDTLPKLTRGEAGTAADGIYAALNVDAGPIEVVAQVSRGGETIVVGDLAATVFPDAVTVVGFAERKPGP